MPYRLRKATPGRVALENPHAEAISDTDNSIVARGEFPPLFEADAADLRGGRAAPRPLELDLQTSP
jgi:hypothetical protein